MPYVLPDTGFWYAAFDSRDTYHAQALPRLTTLEFRDYRVVFPWPIVYETLRTRFVANHDAIRNLEAFMKRNVVHPVDDASYRDKAYQLTFDHALRWNRPISMVDWIIRLILEDRSIAVDYLATFNDSDFYDARRLRRIRLFE